MKKQHIRLPVLCLETGITYPNALAASKAHKRTRCAMANHLAGRAPSLGGKHFVRVAEQCK